jgi:hypothetical protein
MWVRKMPAAPRLTRLEGVDHNATTERHLIDGSGFFGLGSARRSCPNIKQLRILVRAWQRHGFGAANLHHCNGSHS